MGEVLTPDICVIGAGSAGLAVAASAAASNAKVVLVERHKMGGATLHCGAVPAAVLIAAANRVHDCLTAGSFGVHVPVRVDFSRVRQHVHKVIEALAPNTAKERFAGLGVKVLIGAGAFTDSRTLSVDGGVFEIRAQRFVIATGAAPEIPMIPGLAETPHLTSETIFELAQLPPHLLVLGADPNGLELGQAFRRLGSTVTVVASAQPLPADDPECAAIVLQALARDGVAIRSGATVTAVRNGAGGVELTIEAGDAEETLSGTHLLVAAGRVPRIDSLGLDRARVRHRAGRIVVNRQLRTSNARIYAVGDVVGAASGAHVANYHATLVVPHAMFRRAAKVSYNAVPRVIYTDPEFAQVGLSDEEAKRKGYAIRVLRWPYHDNDRAQAERLTLGHVKVVTDKRGRLLGVALVGARASELIAPWALAMSAGLDIGAVARFVPASPTLGQISKRAAMSFFPAISVTQRGPRLLRWLRRQ